MILSPLQKLPKNGEDWGKLIAAKGFKKLPKVQNIAQSGHTDQIAPPKLLPNFVEYSPQLHKHLRCLLNCFLCFENRQSRHSGKSFCC